VEVFNGIFGNVSKEVWFIFKRNYCLRKILLGVLAIMIVQFSANSTYGFSYAAQVNNPNVVYELFPTDNIWTFLKLNTRNGCITQVQYDVNKNNRMEVDLNTTPFVEEYQEQNGRFTLYHTKNMYNFILLDQVDGRTWQVQWAIENDKRLVFPIPHY